MMQNGCGLGIIKNQGFFEETENGIRKPYSILMVNDRDSI